MQMKINLPLFIDIPRKTMKPRRMYINLNNYRNWNYIVNNQVKKIYKEKVYDAIPDEYRNFKYITKVRMTFRLFPGSKRKIDRSNVLSITEKFFCDALVEIGMLRDDNDNYIESTFYDSGYMDKNNPRVEVTIHEL